MPKNITDKIYTIRGQKVMLDYDLAGLYGYTTKAFNQQVKNNIEKFEGEEFMFRLTKSELESLRSNFLTLKTDDDLILNIETNSLRSQNVILKNGRGEHSKYLPHAFTEQGI